MNQIPPQTQSPGRFSGQPPLFWVAVASCVLLIIGGFGPWASAFRGIASVNGTEGDGWFAIIGGALALGLLFLAAGRQKARHTIGLLAIAAICALVFAVDYSDISDKGPIIDVEWGLWAVLIGAIGLAGSTVGLLVTRREPQPVT